MSQTVIAQENVFSQPAPPKEVTVTEIPGVVAAGAKWRLIWAGNNNADGLVGTADGGILFGQEEPNNSGPQLTEGRVGQRLNDSVAAHLVIGKTTLS